MKKEPPDKLDNANVIYWACSGDEPFFVLLYSNGSGGIPIYGLAICKYDNGVIYRFSCNKNWEVINDTDHESIEDAMNAPSGQYEVKVIYWQKR